MTINQTSIANIGIPVNTLPMDEIERYVPKLADLAHAQGTLCTASCPVGSILTLHLIQREDFEFAIRTLLHKGEPVPIPSSMGAMFINGLWNYPKIKRFLEGFESSDEGMAAVMADKQAFKTQLIILSNGPYSAVSAAEMELDEEAWIDHSLAIRFYHELAHHVCRMRYPQNIDALRDEVIADMSGIVGAFGSYDVNTALLFFGIDADSARSDECTNASPIREGGRLWNYLQDDDDPAAAVQRVKAIVARIADVVERTRDGRDPLDLIASQEFQDAIVLIG